MKGWGNANPNLKLTQLHVLLKGLVVHLVFQRQTDQKGREREGREKTTREVKWLRYSCPRLEGIPRCSISAIDIAVQSSKRRQSESLNVDEFMSNYS